MSSAAAKYWKEPIHKLNIGPVLHFLKKEFEMIQELLEIQVVHNEKAVEVLKTIQDPFRRYQKCS